MSKAGSELSQMNVIALTESIRLMAAIDQVIEQHGGWPWAFQVPDSAQEEEGPPPEAAAP